MSSSNCYFLTCIQVSQEIGKVVWYSHLFKNVPQFVVIHTGKGFSIVNESRNRCFLSFFFFFFLEFSCFLHDPINVGNLFSGSSAFSKLSLYIWMFSIHILLRPILKTFEHNFASIWNGCNCMVVWTFSVIALLGDWNGNWPFPVPWPLLSFPNSLTYWVQHFNSIIC